MKRTFSAIFGAACLSATAFLAACSDDSSSSPSKAEECANGLTAECIEGSWDLQGMVSLQDTTMSDINAFYNYTAAPGKLTFTEDGSFQFDLPVGSPTSAETDCNPVYGNWTVENGVLTMKSTVGNVCLISRNKTLTPVIKVEANVVKMRFNELWLLYNETDEESVRSYYAELFSISAN